VSFSFSASYAALWGLAIFQGLLILALLRQLAELRRLIEQRGLPSEGGLQVGTPAPEFEGIGFGSTRPVSLGDLNGQGGVILFLSACEVCIRLVDSLRQSSTIDLPPIVAFCQGGEVPCARIAKGLPPGVHVLLKSAEETAMRYGISSVPTAVVVDEKRAIRGYGHPEGIEDLRQLLARSLGEGPREVDSTGKPHASVLASGAFQ
jgi:hypothetical protein